MTSAGEVISTCDKDVEKPFGCSFAHWVFHDKEKLDVLCHTLTEYLQYILYYKDGMGSGHVI